MDFHCRWQLTSCSVPGYGRNFMIHQISLPPSINTHWLRGCSVQTRVVWLSGHQVSMQPSRQESTLLILVPSELWKREETSAPLASEPKDVKVGPVSVKAKVDPALLPERSANADTHWEGRVFFLAWTLCSLGEMGTQLSHWSGWTDYSDLGSDSCIGKSGCEGQKDSETQVIPKY